MAHLVLTIPEWREKAGQPRSRLLTRIEHDKARQRLETDEGSCSELPGIVALVQPVRLSWPTRDVGHAGVAISRKVGTRREKNKEREGLLRALRTKLPWGGQLGRELFKRNETSHFPRSPPPAGTLQRSLNSITPHVFGSSLRGSSPRTAWYTKACGSLEVMYA